MTIREASFYILNKLKTTYEEGEASQLADMAMEHITGSGKTERMLYKNEAITGKEEALVTGFTERLLRHEPIQYILHEAWFFKQKFYVNEQVLIPRPETEELVEWIIADNKHRPETLTILDIGTGSGCIPITLRKKIAASDTWAIDISEGALAVAKKNAETLQAPVHLLQLDILEERNWHLLPAFDIIVSNPPYIPVRDKQTMHPNVLEFEPHTALFVPNEDALLFYRAIASFAATHLKKNGLLYFEIHEEMGPSVLQLLQEKGFTAGLRKDMQQKDRMVKSGLV